LKATVKSSPKSKKQREGIIVLRGSTLEEKKKGRVCEGMIMIPEILPPSLHRLRHMGNSLRRERTRATTENATGHSVDGYLPYAPVANMGVAGTWGKAEIVVQPTPAVIKSFPANSWGNAESGEAVGILKLDRSTHLKVLDYLKPDLTVGELFQGRKGTEHEGGGGFQLCSVDP
jgi:hypothetical protein